MSKSIVKSSPIIRTKLQERIKLLDLSLTEVSEDANKRGMKISISSLSRYFSNSKTNNLSEENIIFLSYRYGIFVTLHIGTLAINHGKASFHIPDYNEERCLAILNKEFPPHVKTRSAKATRK